MIPIIGIISSSPEKTASDAISPPIASEPVSPIKIFAGKQLKQRKPTSEPASASEIIEKFVKPCKYRMTANVIR